MSNGTLYKKENFKRLLEFSQHAPKAFQSFLEFNNAALAGNTLSSKLKECIAVAVAHITGCPYCIDLHVTQLKEFGGSKEDMSEAIMVATALKAGAALAHGVNALNAYDETLTGDSLYEKTYFNRLGELSKTAPHSFKAFIQFDQEVMKDGVLSHKEKELIAVASAHTTGCPYCIDLHTTNAKRAGASIEEISESIFVATALKAGAAIAHGVNALQSFEPLTVTK